MLNKLSILFALALLSCSQPSKQLSVQTAPVATVVTDNLPAGFSIVEQNPDGYFIRLSSPEKASQSTIRSIADNLIGRFDRVDLCLDVAYERGDEYVSIIGGQVFDYENDRIYSLEQ